MYALPLVSILLLSDLCRFQNVSPINVSKRMRVLAYVRNEYYFSSHYEHLLSRIDYIGCVSAAVVTQEIPIIFAIENRHVAHDNRDSLHDRSLCLAVNQLLNRAAYRYQILNMLLKSSPILIIFDNQIAIDVISKATELSTKEAPLDIAVICLRAVLTACVSVAFIVVTNAKLQRDMEYMNPTATDLDITVLPRECVGLLRGHRRSLARVRSLKHCRN